MFVYLQQFANQTNDWPIATDQGNENIIPEKMLHFKHEISGGQLTSEYNFKQFFRKDQKNEG